MEDNNSKNTKESEGNSKEVNSKNSEGFLKSLKSLNSREKTFWTVLIVLVIIVGLFLFVPSFTQEGSETGGDEMGEDSSDQLEEEIGNNENASEGQEDLENLGEDGVVAKVNGEEIKSEEAKEIIEQYQQQGQQVSSEEIIDQLVEQELISQEAENQGYSVSKEEAEQTVESQMESQAQTSNMSLEEYKKLLEQQGTSFEDIIKDTQEQLSTQNYISDELEGKDLNVSEEEAKAFYDENKEMIEQQSENASYEEAKPQIITMLEQQKQEEAVGVLVENLSEDAEIEYL